jgi:hypothetical protein
MTAVTGRIIPKWPNLFDSKRGETVPDELQGVTIVAIGTLDFSNEKDPPEGGGLVIDYTPKGYLEVRRITLVFTDSGMWRHPLPSPDED